MSSRQELDNLYRRVLTGIEENGWVPINVTDPKDSTKNFIYTVGLTKFQLPEIVITGTRMMYQSNQYLKDFVGAIIARRQVDLDVPFSFQVVDAHIGGHNRSSVRRCMLRTLTAEMLKDTAYFAVNQKVCRPEFGTTQLILADDENRLPTEKGYNTTLVQHLI